MKYTRLILAIAGFSTISIAASAQNRPQFGFQLGLVAGTTRYQTETNHVGTLTTGYKIGLSAGLASRFNLGNRWAIAPGLRYLRTGFTTSETIPTTGSGGLGNTSYHISYALNQLEIPVELLYFFHPSQQGFHLVGGASVGILLGGQRTYETTYTDGTQTGGYSGQDAIKVDNAYPLGNNGYYQQRWDAGVKAGVGYQYRHLAVQASYRIGLVNLAAHSALNLPSPSIYSRLAELQVTYLMPR